MKGNSKALTANEVEIGHEGESRGTILPHHRPQCYALEKGGPECRGIGRCLNREETILPHPRPQRYALEKKGAGCPGKGFAPRASARLCLPRAKRGQSLKSYFSFSAALAW